MPKANFLQYLGQGTLGCAVYFLACSLGTSAAPQTFTLQRGTHTELSHALSTLCLFSEQFLQSTSKHRNGTWKGR